MSYSDQLQPTGVKTEVIVNWGDGDEEEKRRGAQAAVDEGLSTQTN